MRLADMDLFDECFTHVSDTDGAQTTYNVTRLYQYVVDHLDAVQLVGVPIDEEHARYCVERRGVEQDRVRVLLEHPEYLKKPVLFIHMPDDSHLLVDGTHRYVVYWWAKGTTIPAYIVPLAVAQPFIIEDAPTTTEDELMAYSGLRPLRELQQGLK